MSSRFGIRAFFGDKSSHKRGPKKTVSPKINKLGTPIGEMRMTLEMMDAKVSRMKSGCYVHSFGFPNHKADRLKAHSFSKSCLACGGRLCTGKGTVLFKKLKRIKAKKITGRRATRR